MNIKEAALRLSKSEITVRRAIKDGKLKALLEEGRYNISEEALNEYALTTQEIALATQDDQETKRLREESEKLDQEITQLRNQMTAREEQAEERQKLHDETVLQMKQRIEDLKEQLAKKDGQIERLEQLLAIEKGQTRQLLEHHFQPFWRRWFRHKALPAPGDVMDMGRQGAQEGAAPAEDSTDS